MNQVGAALLEVCWLVTLAVLPLVVNPLGGHAFSIYKAVFLYTMVGLMAAVWIFKVGLSLAFSHKTQRHDPPESSGHKALLQTPHVLPALGLAAAYILSTLFSVSPTSSLWGSASRMEGAYTLLALVAFFLMLAWHVGSNAQINRILWALVATGSGVSILGITEWLDWSPWVLQRTYGEWRVGSTIGHPTILGAYLVLTTALLLGKLADLVVSREKPSAGSRTLAVVGLGGLLAIQLVALLNTNARGPWLGFVAMVLTFCGVLLVTHRRWRMLRLAILLLALLIVFQVALSYPGSPFYPLRDLPYLDRAARLLDLKASSGRQRVVIWAATTDLIISRPHVTLTEGSWNWIRPVVGYGPETLRQAFGQVAPAELRYLEPGTSVDRAHNLLLDIAVELGLLGLVAFGWLMASLFWLAGRQVKRAQSISEQVLLASLLAAITGYLVTQMVGVRGIADLLLFWTALALVVALARRANTPSTREPFAETYMSPALTARRLLLGFGASAAALTTLALVLAFNVNLVSADMQARRGVDLMNQQKWREAAVAFERAPHSPPLRSLNLWQLSQAYSFQVPGAAGPAERLNLLDLASRRIEEARALEPAEAGYHQRAALIYSYWTLTLEPAKYEKAVEAFSQAMTLAPHEIRIYNQWADFEAEMRNYGKARGILMRSLDEDPDWGPTHYQLAGVYKLLEQADKAAVAYRRSIELAPALWPAYLDLSKILLASGKSPDARPYAERYVEAQPRQWEGYFVLASIYRSLGMAQAAEAQAQVALSLAPAPFQEQVRQLMDSLR